MATRAGLSRVTVYAHFPTHDALLEAVAARAVERFTAALDRAELDHGDPRRAVDRLIARGWVELDRNHAIARIATEQLGPSVWTRAHGAQHGRIGRLIERGRRAEVFRDDLPTDWLVSSYFALVHACGEGVRAGQIGADDAVPLLQATVGDLLTGPVGSEPS